jgi:aldehyde dehydrogenase (NAD+)
MIVRELTANRAAVRQAAAEVVVGDPLAPGTQMGPIVSLAQLKNVQAAVKHAEVQGATVIAPELRLQSGLAGGYYVP